MELDEIKHEEDRGVFTVAQIKAAVRARDNWRCVDCQMSNAEHQQTTGKSLHVHRKSPGVEYTIEGCVTVCQACHVLRHQEIDKDKPAPSFERGEFLAPLGWRAMIDDASEVLFGQRNRSALIRAAVLEYLKAKGLRA